MDALREIASEVRLIAARFACDRDDVEDGYQEGMFAVCLAMRRLRATRRYLLNAARYAILRHLRAELRWRRAAALVGDVDAVSFVFAGRDFAPALIDAICAHPASADLVVSAEPGALTERERDVLDRLCRGLSYREIAVDLGLVTRSVNFHITNLYRKLGCRNAVQAYNIGIARGLVVPPGRCER